MNKNIKLYLGANAVNLTGAWIYYVAIYWVVYQLTQSASMLGVLSLVIGCPMLFFSFVGGALGDRFPRKKLLCFFQFTTSIVAFILGGISYFYLSTEIFFLFSGILGILSALESPLRQTILPNLLKTNQKISKLISWNAIVNHIARVIGPLMCGGLLSDNRIFLAFILYAIFSMLSFLAIYYLKLEVEITPSKEKDTLGMIHDGLKHIADKKILLYLIIVVSFFGFCIGPYTSQIPSLIKQYYPYDANSLAVYYGATGVGGLFSALLLRTINTTNKISPLFFVGLILSCFATISFFFGMNRYFGASMLLLISFGMMIAAGSGLIYIQNQTTEDYRGRIIGFYHFLYIGLAPIANGVIGFLCGIVGSNNTFIIGAILSIVCGVSFYIYSNKMEKLYLSRLQQ